MFRCHFQVLSEYKPGFEAPDFLFRIDISESYCMIVVRISVERNREMRKIRSKVVVLIALIALIGTMSVYARGGADRGKPNDSNR